MEEKNGCRNQLIFGSIWLIGGFINLIAFRIILMETSVLSSMIPFILPSLSFILGVRIMQVKDFFRWIFGKSNKKLENEIENPKPKYGTTVILASVVLFLIGGLLTSIFQETADNHYTVYLLGGIIWGIIWYLLMQQKIVNHYFDED